MNQSIFSPVYAYVRIAVMFLVVAFLTSLPIYHLAAAPTIPTAATLVITKQDALVIDANNDNIASPSDTLEYTVLITNTGTTPATLLTFNDLPDANTKLVNNSVTTSQGVVAVGNIAGDSSVVINLGTLNANESAKITFRVLINNPLAVGVTKLSNQGLLSGSNIPTQPTDDPASAAVNDPTETLVVAAPKINVTKSDKLLGNNGTAHPSDILEYQVTISNQGNQTAANVVFNDTPDVNTQLVVGSVQTTQGTVVKGNTAGDTGVQVAVGDVAVGKDVVVTFRVTILNILLQPGVTQISNQGFATGSNFPTTPTDDPQTQTPNDPTTTPLITTPRLDAFKSDALLIDVDLNGVPSPGDTLVYNMNIANNGNSAATNVIFQDTPDPNTALVIGSVVTNQGSVVKGNTAGDTTVQVNVGTVNSAASVAISFRVTIDKPIANGSSQISNQGSVQSDGQPNELTDDPDTLQDNDPTITPITAAPQINATKQVRLLADNDNNGIASPGDALEYQVTIGNNGNQTATALQFNDPLDANATLVIGSVTSTQGTVVQGNNPGDTAPQVDIGALPVGQSVTILFHVIINNPLPTNVTQISNQGFIDGSNFPSVPTDDPDTPTADDPTQITITAAPVLNASKLVSLDTDADGDGVPSPGDTLLYQVTIVNSGNSQATSVSYLDKPDINTFLVVGSVKTSRGVVASGNGNGDTEVNIQGGDLPGAGGTLVLSYQVVINKTLPATVFQIKNQGAITCQELPTVLTDDPTTAAIGDPTIIPVRVLPVLSATKRGNLLIDANSNSIAEPGDTLRYAVTIINTGNAPVTNLVYSDTIDVNTTLVANSVQSNLGTVISGNSSSDRRVKINIGSLASGSKVTITYLVRVNSPLPVGVTKVTNQGLLTSNELNDLHTDDPIPNGSSDPTVIPVVGSAHLEVSKKALLWVDADKDRKVTLNDILLYEVRIVNTGNSSTGSTNFQDTPDAKTILVSGSVQTSQGTVITGNTTGDSQINIQIGVIPPGGSVTLSFQVRINLNTNGVVNNQAQTLYTEASDPAGQSLIAYSDDPDTVGKVNDPTTTAIDGPTALEEETEPTAPLQNHLLFFPTILQ